MLLETDRQNYPEEWLCHLRVCDDLLPKKQQHKAFSEVMVCTGIVILTVFLLTSVFETGS